MVGVVVMGSSTCSRSGDATCRLRIPTRTACERTSNKLPRQRTQDGGFPSIVQPKNENAHLLGAEQGVENLAKPHTHGDRRPALGSCCGGDRSRGDTTTRQHGVPTSQEQLRWARSTLRGRVSWANNGCASNRLSVHGTLALSEGVKATTQHVKTFARAAQGPPDRARAHSSCHESVGQSVMSRSGGSDDPCRRTGKAERANFECNFVMIGRHLAHRIIIKLPITERSHPAHRSRVCVHRRRHLCAVLWLCVRVRDTLERDRRESGTSVPGVAPCAPWRCPARAGWRKGPSFSHVGRLNQ